MALDRNQAVRLAHALRELRESAWPDIQLTQAQLANALSSEGKVAPATLASWESTTNPKTPPEAKVRAYARFFSTERSLDGEPHLIPEDQLTPAEKDRLRELQSRLLKLSKPGARHHSFKFEAGPVIVICPTAPPDVQGPLGDPRDPNFTALRRYGDLDALIELYGHLRAENPTLDVFHRLTADVHSDDFSSHVILLGGIGWNPVTEQFQSALGQVPVTQIEVANYQSGEVFQAETPAGVKTFYPEFEKHEDGAGEQIVADIGYLVRLRNPFRVRRTLTICNGTLSRGVYGAVRCLTDARVREDNESYLADRFPGGEFAMLVRVPVVANETVSPDLQNPESRLYEWAPEMAAR